MQEAPRLREHQDALPEHHECRNRHDLRTSSERLLGLGVHLAEDDVRVLVRGGFEDRSEHPAGPTPRRPPVDEHDAVLCHGRFECLCGQGDGAHGGLLGSVLPTRTTIPPRVFRERHRNGWSPAWAIPAVPQFAAPAGTANSSKAASARGPYTVAVPPSISGATPSASATSARVAPRLAAPRA